MTRSRDVANIDTILTTKGDIYAASAAYTPARLGVGNNGETLVADSSTSTGLRWTPSLASKNYVINGAMDWWQRGTSGFTTGGAYTADRWLIGANSGTLAASRSTDVPTNPYFNYSYSLGGTSAQNTQIYTRIESIEASQLAGQTVTLTVWAKSTAGTTKISFATVYPSATDSWGGSNVTDVIGDLSGTSPSGSWTRYTATFTVNALATRGYQVIIYRNGTETSTTLITGVKLELGSVSTPFTRAGGTLAGELQACQRYYVRYTGAGDSQRLSPLGGSAVNTVVDFVYSLPVPLRNTATTLDVGNIVVYNNNNNLTYNSGNFTILAGNPVQGLTIRYTHGTGVFTQGGNSYIMQSGSTAGFVGIGAEL